ncbi:unnamed protein product [Ilex paraguariensis]|uniref:Smr domain-containing protein n=1 Tax=Ilex paraguariensis TaxID=185542 RepID=A0ABC8S8T6_9AQUA
MLPPPACFPKRWCGWRYVSHFRRFIRPLRNTTLEISSDSNLSTQFDLVTISLISIFAIIQIYTIMMASGNKMSQAWRDPQLSPAWMVTHSSVNPRTPFWVITEDELFHLYENPGMIDTYQGAFILDDMIMTQNFERNENIDVVSIDELVDSLNECRIEEKETDDIYLLNRQDAFMMTNLACLHSKASRDAYLKGDHLSARVFSQMAQEEKQAAKVLNDKAAKEILRIENCNNDIWQLDLHGLHAMEAVQALEEHLQIIESEASISLGQRRRSLLVITGRGVHSRGQAVLPTAIRSFLSERGYHYDDSRPGVFTVRPRFHC